MQTVKITPLTATSSQSVSNTHWSHWGSPQGKAVLRRRGQAGSRGGEVRHSKPRTRMETCRALLPWSSISTCLSVPRCTSLPKKYCSPERAQISACQADGPIPPYNFNFRSKSGVHHPDISSKYRQKSLHVLQAAFSPWTQL